MPLYKIAITMLHIQLCMLLASGNIVISIVLVIKILLNYRE